jgi:hypothetical protein
LIASQFVLEHLSEFGCLLLSHRLLKQFLPKLGSEQEFLLDAHCQNLRDGFDDHDEDGLCSGTKSESADLGYNSFNRHEGTCPICRYRSIPHQPQRLGQKLDVATGIVSLKLARIDLQAASNGVEIMASTSTPNLFRESA